MRAAATRCASERSRASRSPWCSTCCADSLGLPYGRKPVAEVGELVGVDDRPDSLDGAVGDLEGEDVDQASLGVERQDGRLAVDVGRDHPRVELAIGLEEADQQA